jgi:hypothetical protein
MFTKEERSTFPYWFAHWCAFQMTALNHRMWKPKYLFHDIEKPWLRLFFPYPKVQRWHRMNHNHHLEWIERKLSNIEGCVVDIIDGFDYEQMVIDWDCSRFTKTSSPRNAAAEINAWFNTPEGLEKMKDKYPFVYGFKEIIYNKCKDVLKKYDFPEPNTSF